MSEIRLITGRSRHLIMRAVEDGMPVHRKPDSRNGDWLFNLGDCLRWWMDKADAAPKVSVTEDGEVLDLNAQKARLAKEQADKLERERHLDERRLVPADAVHRLIEQLVGGANARLGAMPAKLAPIVNPEDPAGARRHLELGIEEVRAELRRLETDEPRDADAA